MTYRHYLISGRVQGVGYRNFVIRCADGLDLVGWVRNISDGRVEAVAGGEEAKLAEFEKELKRGPALSRVTTIKASICTNPEYITESFLKLDDALQAWEVP